MKDAERQIQKYEFALQIYNEQGQIPEDDEIDFGFNNESRKMPKKDQASDVDIYHLSK